MAGVVKWSGVWGNTFDYKIAEIMRSYINLSGKFCRDTIVINQQFILA